MSGVARPRERDLLAVAGAAGVPDTIWNMDARAGAVTAAYVKGAQPTDAMDLGTHTQLATNRRDFRSRLAAKSRIAMLRLRARANPEMMVRKGCVTRLDARDRVLLLNR